jgi:hypothetical protein
MTLFVRRIGGGLWGIPDADDEYSEPVAFTEDDIRQYAVSVPSFADALRKANGISGTDCISDNGLLSLGQKTVRSAGSVDVYLSFPNFDETQFRSRCQRLKELPAAQGRVLLTPRGVSMSAETRRLLDSTGVILVPLTPFSGKGDLALDWLAILKQAAQGKRRSKGSTRSWTQPDLDEAIREYKAKRAPRYQELVEAVRRGDKGAKVSAQKMFGRNAIARELGVRATAMVSESTAWVEIAMDLGLFLARDRVKGMRGARRSGKIGMEIALEQQAVAAADVTDPAASLKRAERAETLRLIRQLPDKLAEPILSKYEAGEITDEQARGQVKVLLNQS